MSKLPMKADMAADAQKLIDKAKPFVASEKLDEFKVGNVFIEEKCDYYGNYSVSRDRILKTAKKFKVVYISPEGVPVLRELDKGGKVYGWPRVPHNLLLRAKYGCVDLPTLKTKAGYYITSEVGRFLPDNEVFDSILLGDKYKPMEDAKRKNQLLKEIRKHNRESTISRSSQAVMKWMRQCKAGDVIWDSANRTIVIQSWSNHDDLWQVNVTYHYGNNQVHNDTWTLDSILKRKLELYSAQPRDFKKESADEGLV